ATIEPRSGGTPAGNHTLVFSFLNTLSAVSSVTATATTSGGPQDIAAANISHVESGNLCTVNLTSIPNASHLSVTLHGASDTAGNSGDIAPVRMDVLWGDVNQSGRVDGTDVSLVRQQNFQPVNNNASTSNYLEDINASGRIDGTDVSIARQQNFSVL